MRSAAQYDAGSMMFTILDNRTRLSGTMETGHRFIAIFLHEKEDRHLIFKGVDPLFLKKLFFFIR
jgi:hypothetical protein